jgi:hypothetical protein
MMTPVTANTSGKMPVRNTTNCQMGPAVAALVDPAHPLRRAVACERAGQTLDDAAAILDYDGGNLAVLGVAQLHAPDRADIPRAFASVSLLCALLFSAPRATALGRARISGWQEYDGGPRAGLQRQGARQRALRHEPRVAHDGAEHRPLALRRHRRDRPHELAGGPREAEIDAGERHRRDRHEQQR